MALGGAALTCSDSGFRANWMLHSPTMPRCCTTFTAVRRSMKYSVLLRVWLGATTMDSPVWIPSGSRFSMLHTWQWEDTMGWGVQLLHTLPVPCSWLLLPQAGPS